VLNPMSIQGFPNIAIALDRGSVSKSSRPSPWRPRGIVLVLRIHTRSAKNLHGLPGRTDQFTLYDVRETRATHGRSHGEDNGEWLDDHAPKRAERLRTDRLFRHPGL